MTYVSNDLAAAEDVHGDDVDSQKRQWLHALHQPVAHQSSSLIQEPTSPESIVADFIRQHSASGQLVATLLDAMCQHASDADILCIQGSEDTYFYSTQTMTANYAEMCVQVVENDICRAIAEAVRFDCQTYPRPYKVAMLAQPPYHFAPEQVTAALTAMETHPDYADIRAVESSNAEPYLFSERFMSYGKAYGLCEWLEVEQYQNP